ncbi:hypothetical protein J8M20_13690 [Pseudoalteromonas luteoviolacea]|uniref:hypothetical protein n=1 Tax=Pseudoalteromonas luteoviolacea TaxID=43657 RepID=UPI001B381C89|nr:hypothetical protein [Pseudoalteromonas luteoviolacea]MBQ4812404.1 hypothetical protein [Pseudoalteromonas luteoviolacea]
MKTLSMATWNCQRVQASSNGIARLKTDNLDIIMLQEAPKPFRDAYPAGGGIKNDDTGNYHVIAPKTDNQQDAYACRSYILLKKSTFEGVVRKELPVQSGAHNAYRYPAMADATVKVDNKDMILRIISAHTTSGFGGAHNTDEVIEAITEFDSTTVVGADFNSNEGVYSGPLKIPANKTQKSGHAIDGFTKENGNYIDNEKRLLVEIKDVIISNSFRLILDDGCYLNGTNVRLSDHIPVVSKLECTLANNQ